MVTIINVLCANWQMGTLDDDISFLGKEATILNFLRAALGDSTSPKEIAKAMKENLEDQLDIKKSKRARVLIKAKIVGDYHFWEGVIILVANLVLDQCCRYGMKIEDEKELSTLTRHLIMHADLITITEFKSWLNKFMTNHEHIPEVMINHIHSIVTSFAKVAGNTILLRKIAKDDDIPVKAYKDCVRVFDTVTNEIWSSIASNSIRTFLSPLHPS